MPKLYITVGASSTGKSSWAEQKIKETDNIVNINRDDIRFANNKDAGWSEYEYTKSNELRVSKIVDEMFEQAVKDGKDVIMSNNNLTNSYRNNLIKKGKAFGYTIICVLFETSLHTLLKRNKVRKRQLDESVIKTQHNWYLDAKVVLETQCAAGLILIKYV